MVLEVRKRLLPAVLLIGLGFLPAGPLVAEPAAEPVDDYHRSFQRFDQELKAVLRAENLPALTLLVHFPLRINHSDGSVTSLDSPLTLIQRFSEVFTPEVRKGILESKGEDFIFRSSDVGFGGGVAWAAEFYGEEGDSFFRLHVINLGKPGPDPNANKLKLAFACQTRKHRILIEHRSNDGLARYRVWNRPKSPLEAPDLEIENGKAGWEGSGVCGVHYWEFPVGAGTTIRASELACGTGEEPNGATGQLTVTKKDGTEQSWYCF